MPDTIALDEATVVRTYVEAAHERLDQFAEKYGVALYPDPVRMCRQLRDVLGLEDVSDYPDLPFLALWQEALYCAKGWVDETLKWERVIEEASVI